MYLILQTKKYTLMVEYCISRTTTTLITALDWEPNRMEICSCFPIAGHNSSERDVHCWWSTIAQNFALQFIPIYKCGVKDYVLFCMETMLHLLWNCNSIKKCLVSFFKKNFFYSSHECKGDNSWNIQELH
jgi:hypothetical protein